MNYAVPHFGTDHDINNSLEDLALAEKQRGHKWVLKDDPPEPDRNYFVPHFGADHEEVVGLQQSLAAAEKQHNHKYQIKEEDKEDIKRNYPVVQLGEDKDITATKASLEYEEKRLGKWNYPEPDPPGIDRDYFVPHFGIDHDIVDSLSHLKQEEAIHGQWNLPKDDYYQVQLDSDMDREPLLSWSPTPPKTFKMNYFVPNFGEDHDITASKAHEAAAAKTLDLEWVPTKDKDGEWELPSPQIEFKLAQTIRR